MTAQAPLPLLPEGAVPIGDAAGLLVGEAGGAVFVWGALWWSWQDGDEAGRRIAAVQLATGKIATRIEIAAAFDTTPATLWRWCRDYDRDGIAGLVPAKPGPKGAWKLTDEIIGQIVALDAQGLTQAKVAERAGVSSFSVRQVLAERARPAATETAGADEVNGLPVVPAPTPRTGERQAARYGQLGEAVPVFTQGRQLPLAGLLLCLPALEATGLLEVAGQVYGKLKSGFYGLKPMLLTLVFLALLREPRAEGATRIVPGDLGRILAFDRAPEVSTIRRKLGELSAQGKAGQLMAGLARHHLATHPDAVGFLYIDGHVRAYHGTRRLPKAHVARMRIAMPPPWRPGSAIPPEIPFTRSSPHPRHRPQQRCGGCCPTSPRWSMAVAPPSCSTGAAGHRGCSPTCSTRASTCSPTAKATTGPSPLRRSPNTAGSMNVASNTSGNCPTAT